MGGFNKPKRITVDPLAESLRPLRGLLGRFGQQALQDGFLPRRSPFPGLQSPVNQLFPGGGSIPGQNPFQQRGPFGPRLPGGNRQQVPLSGGQAPPSGSRLLNSFQPTTSRAAQVGPRDDGGGGDIGGGGGFDLPGAPQRRTSPFNLPQFSGPFAAPLTTGQLDALSGFRQAVFNNPIVSNEALGRSFKGALGGNQIFDPTQQGFGEFTDQFDQPSVADPFFQQLFGGQGAGRQGGAPPGDAFTGGVPGQGGGSGGGTFTIPESAGTRFVPPPSNPILLAPGAQGPQEIGDVNPAPAPVTKAPGQPQPNEGPGRPPPPGTVPTNPTTPQGPTGRGQSFSEDIIRAITPDVIGAFQTALDPGRARTGQGRRAFDDAVNFALANASEEASSFGLNPGAIDRAAVQARGVGDIASRLGIQQQQADTGSIAAQDQARTNALAQARNLPGFFNTIFSNELQREGLDLQGQANQISALPSLLRREQRGTQNALDILNPAANRSLQALGLAPGLQNLPLNQLRGLFDINEQARGAADQDITRRLSEFQRTQGGQLQQILSILSGSPGFNTGFGPSTLSQIGSLAKGIGGIVSPF